MSSPRSRHRRSRRRYASFGLILGLVIGLVLVAGGGYIAYRIVKRKAATPATASDERSRLDAFSRAIIGRWEGVTDSGNRAIIEFRTDGSTNGSAVVNGQRVEAHGRWEAIRTDGDRVIVRTTVEGTSVELPYWFVSSDEYHYVAPAGHTRTLRRIK